MVSFPSTFALSDLRFPDVKPFRSIALSSAALPSVPSQGKLERDRTHPLTQNRRDAIEYKHLIGEAFKDHAVPFKAPQHSRLRQTGHRTFNNLAQQRNWRLKRSLRSHGSRLLEASGQEQTSAGDGAGEL